MEYILEQLRKYRELISYLFWGVMTTIMSWGSYSIFAILFKNQVHQFSLFGIQMSVVVLLSNILSWICAFLFAFVTNKMWVFESKSWKPEVCLPEFGKFFSARALTGALEIIAVPLLVAAGLNQTIFGVEGMAAKVIVSVVVVVLNYIFSKLFIFKKRS
jgi:putative flippase GtrA